MKDEALSNMTHFELVTAINNATLEFIGSDVPEKHTVECIAGDCDNPDCPLGDALHLMRELVSRVKQPDIMVRVICANALRHDPGISDVTLGDTLNELDVVAVDGKMYRITFEQINADEDA